MQAKVKHFLRKLFFIGSYAEGAPRDLEGCPEAKSRGGLMRPCFFRPAKR